MRSKISKRKEGNTVYTVQNTSATSLFIYLFLFIKGQVVSAPLQVQKSIDKVFKSYCSVILFTYLAPFKQGDFVWIDPFS